MSEAKLDKTFSKSQFWIGVYRSMRKYRPSVKESNFINTLSLDLNDLSKTFENMVLLGVFNMTSNNKNIQ